MSIDTINFIKACIENRSIRWTYHVNMRLKGRYISRDAIVSSLDKYEIIEEYPTDKYLPSFLIFTKYKNIAIHIQIATDFKNNCVTIVTAYKPNLDKWEKDYKTRRKQ